MTLGVPELFNGMEDLYARAQALCRQSWSDVDICSTLCSEFQLWRSDGGSHMVPEWVRYIVEGILEQEAPRGP